MNEKMSMEQKLQKIGMSLHDFGIKCEQCTFHAPIRWEDLFKWIEKKCPQCKKYIILTLEDYNALIEWEKSMIDPVIENATEEDINRAKEEAEMMFGMEPKMEIKMDGSGKLDLIATDFDDFEGREI